MGRSRRVTLRTRSFDKVGDANAFFSAMLNRYKIGDRVNAEDAADLSALLERHDQREEKIGNGVAGFEVNIPPIDVPQHSRRCFWIVDSEDNKIDFSIGHCLKARPDD